MAVGFSNDPIAPRSLLALLVVSIAIPALAHVADAKKSGIWLTTRDKSSLLAPQSQPLSFRKSHASDKAIVIDDKTRFQTMDGFGHSLTGGSAQLMMKMSPTARTALLQELFGNGPGDIHTSYIRVTVGASDMNDHVYTYDDLPAGQTDPALEHFTLADDRKDVIPILKEILAIQPGIKILASPWTAPAWMKDNDNIKGGTLKPEFYATYAAYWVKYLQGMQAEGIRIDALTPQNEPENPKNTPSMVLTAAQEATFIGQALGPALQKAGLKTKVISFDHNCDNPGYPTAILNDPVANRYTEGSGFHLYLGKITAMTAVHDAFPNKSLYFTEQMVVSRKNDTGFEVAKPTARIVIDAPLNWSRNVLLWNLAADPQSGPHTSSGGCPFCSGAITLDGDKVTRNIAYYAAAHASKFVPPGSVRIASPGPTDALPHVAFLTPSRRHVLLVSNPTDAESRFVIQFQGKQAQALVPAGAVATYVW